MLKHFLWSFVAVVIGLSCAFWRGQVVHDAGFSFLITAFCISLLEVAISFDNAVVNAEKLEHMSHKWQERFLTWGILIAVFGMRFLFPILVVSIFAGLPFLKVIDVALAKPDEYVAYLHDANAGIVSFGGMFLMMLFLKFFIDKKKEVDWLGFVERPLKFLAKIKFSHEIIGLAALLILVVNLPQEEMKVCAISGISGILLFLVIDTVAHRLEKHHKTSANAVALTGKAGFMAFLYLELIDASFSLDGVLGAFAFTKDVVVIVVGLGIGAMFVRSITLALVEHKTLDKFRFLTNGAYWAIGALSVIMLRSAVEEVPEAIAASLSIVFIVLSIISSLLYNKKQEKAASK